MKRFNLFAGHTESATLLAVEIYPDMNLRTSSVTRTTYIATASLFVAVLVLALKYLAYHFTGSLALYSDALESIVNVVTAAAALIAVRLAQKPADAALPYGYHKAEYFSAVVVGVMIVVAAILIFRDAWFGFFAPRTLNAPLQGIAINSTATVLNAVWAFVLLRYGRQVKSPALVADGKHLFTDVASSLGVLLGLILVLVTGWAELDAILAALVGLNILWSGWGVIKESVGGLMDVATPPESLKKIREIISENADGAIEAHDIRTRQAGRMTFIDFHLVVPGTMMVEQSHEICDRIEEKLREAMRDTEITIHVEPESKAKHSGVVVL